MTIETHPDHSWQAFRYFSGEMSGDEATAFEVLLTDDQAAREAVAEAVELAFAVSSMAAGTPSTWSRGRRWPAHARRSVPWVGGGIAACLALVFSLRGEAPRPPAADLPRAPQTALAHEQEVALAWSGLHVGGEFDPECPSDLLAWSDEPTTEPDLEADSPLPPWLIEAASLPGLDPAETKEN